MTQFPMMSTEIGEVAKALAAECVEVVFGLPGDPRHLYDALATGVDQHMGLIDERINEGRDVGVSGDATDPGTETFEFFKERGWVL